jgi:hypothetical protein
MITTNSRFVSVAMGVLAMLYVTGCETSSQAPQDSAVSDLGALSNFDVNAYPLNKVVCDPMGGGGNATAKQGIKAELYYRSQGQPIYRKAQDYIDHTTKASQNVFFTEMFVPTRLFSLGFSTQTSEVLKDDQGQTLIEYFGLKMNTTIRLAPNDAEGVYEFALLSDDGSVMRIKENGNWVEAIGNDGDHSTRFGCSTKRITMTRDTKLETEILYYQGPRTEIANTLMWRKLSDAQAAGQDSACGATGQTYWFDYLHGSTPTVNFNSLFLRNWNVVSAGNFYLPEESTETTQYNPCTAGSDPIISNMEIAEIVNTDVWIIWDTDIPATSQLMITNVATGGSTITTSDNRLRTHHIIHASNLLPGTHYQVRGINISEDLGKTISAPLDITTP